MTNSTSSQRIVRRRLVLGGVSLALGCSLSSASLDANLARDRFVSGSAHIDDAVPQYATDGKLGPSNRWVTGTRRPHRLNIFFEREVEIGTLHLYSGGDRDAPVNIFSVQYIDSGGSLLDVPGGSVSGNTDWFVALDFASPVTTSQIQILIQDTAATVQEVAVFPPSATPRQIGDGINAHLGLQHRRGITTASATTGGSSRRSIVDGFVSNAEYWRSGTSGFEWIAMDLRDPDETSPPTVRTTTVPVEVGSVHLYSGRDSAEPAISRGRFQRLDDSTGNWVDIPGGSFDNNTERALSVIFDAPVTTAALRLVVQSGQCIVREMVPLPPNDGAGWPIGTSVTFDRATDYRLYGDDYYGLQLAGSSGLYVTASDGAAVLRPSNTFITQQYQVLLNVGTNTYRIRNRATGLCLEPENASMAPGAAVVETEYAALPTQRWLVQPDPGGVKIVNSATGLVLTAAASVDGATLEQRDAGDGLQSWSLESRDTAVKKGTGGWGNLADQFGINWGYNWGPGDNFPAPVDFWPMQWGSFNWTQRPSLSPEWRRNGEDIILMGYNEPDKVDQSNMPVSTAAGMWPRLEVLGMPLLGPAVAGHPATSPWIQDFMARVASEELRVEYVGMHSYGGPDANSFINKITDAHNVWGRDVVVSEFSVVDWSNTNNWNDDQVYNWFAEVLWRMEKLPYLSRYAVFVFTEEPSNPISDNRGEMRNADGTLSPEGRLYAAWDGDTQARTDTPYLLHNKGARARIGAVPGAEGTASTTIGDRQDDTETFQWRLVPGSAPGLYRVHSVADDRAMWLTARGLELFDIDAVTVPLEFQISEIQHGWFALIEPGLGRRLQLSGSSFSLAVPGTTSDNVRWRLAPVYNGVPGPPRDGTAVPVGGNDVTVSWAEHGFRDLIGFNVYRLDPGAPNPRLVAFDLNETTFTDTVPAAGTYVYSVSAVGDTGESEQAVLDPVEVTSCPADIAPPTGVLDIDDVLAFLDGFASSNPISDLADPSGVFDIDDVLAFLDSFASGCP